MPRATDSWGACIREGPVFRYRWTRIFSAAADWYVQQVTPRKSHWWKQIPWGREMTLPKALKLLQIAILELTEYPKISNFRFTYPSSTCFNSRFLSTPRQWYTWQKLTKCDFIWFHILPNWNVTPLKIYTSTSQCRSFASSWARATCWHVAASSFDEAAESSQGKWRLDREFHTKHLDFRHIQFFQSIQQKNTKWMILKQRNVETCWSKKTPNVPNFSIHLLTLKWKIFYQWKIVHWFTGHFAKVPRHTFTLETLGSGHGYVSRPFTWKRPVLKGGFSSGIQGRWREPH